MYRAFAAAAALFSSCFAFAGETGVPAAPEAAPAPVAPAEAGAPAVPSEPAAAAAPTPSSDVRPPSAATATPPPAAETPAALSVAVLHFAGEGDEKQLAANLGGLALARLAERPGVRAVGQEEVEAIIGFERARQLIGCEGDACVAEIGGALGVKYLLHGGLGRVGKTFVVRLALIDVAQGLAVHRVVAKVEGEDALIPAVEAGADEIFDKAGFPVKPRGTAGAAEPAPPAGVPAVHNWHIAVKPGPEFIATLLAFGVTLDVELGYLLRPDLLLFFQPGLSVSASSINQFNAAVVPVLAGARYLFITGSAFRPYVGLGLGLNFIAPLVAGQGLGSVGISFTGTGGVEWMPWKQVGFLLEASLNLKGGVRLSGAGLEVSPTVHPGVIVTF